MSSTETLSFENARALQALYVNDIENLKRLEDQFHVKLTTREDWIKIEGPREAVAKVKDIFQQLHLAREKGGRIRRHEFNYAINAADQPAGARLSDLYDTRIQFSLKKPPILPRTLRQKEYIEGIKDRDLAFGLGPAGTGKTFLAMAMAVAALKNEQVSRIILTRPAVEAGEALGFLPGDLQEKIFPYLRPLYDALHDMLEPDEIQRMMDKGVIEIAPLAYMRGRTLNHSFIILDEAQNTTTEQMFMFLTRMGAQSKCVVTGDTTQIDLPHNKKSGLIEAAHALKNTAGIFFCQFEEIDVVRHELVQKIVLAYKAHRGNKLTSNSL